MNKLERSLVRSRTYSLDRKLGSEKSWTANVLERASYLQNGDLLIVSDKGTIEDKPTASL